MSEIYYERVSEKVVVAAGAESTIVFDKTRSPYEELTFWAWPYDNSTPPDYDLTAKLNDQSHTALTAVATNLPQKIQIAGIFPPDLESGAPETSVIPSLTIKNNEVDPRTFVLVILAKIYGPAV